MKQPMKRKRRLALVGSLLTLGMLSWATMSLADNVIVNDISTSPPGGSVADETVNKSVGDSGTAVVRLNATDGDGRNGCNADGAPVTLNVVSDNLSAVTVNSPGQVTISQCGGSGIQSIGYQAVGAGTAHLSASYASGGRVGAQTASAYNFNDNLTVVVTAPPPSNTPPQVSVTGVTDGASYNKGSVPAAGCSVVDAEDTGESATPTLSAITGPYASDGIGQQTATCSYTDGGGLTRAASATYSIVDPSAPQISRAITGTLGNNGWYVSDVNLDWTVSELQSPGSLSITGCTDTNITADQAATNYACQASSAGGSANDSVSIKRDATKPTISGSRSPGGNGYGWNNGNVGVSFSCADPLSNGVHSGLASCGPDTTVSTEGANQSVTGTAEDNAGNTKQDTVSGISIDKTNPTISGSRSPAANANGWNKDDVVVSFTCNDDRSGVASCEPDHTVSSEGAGQSVTGHVTDRADNGNQTTVSPINVDKTDPTIDGAATTSPNSNGWYKSNITVHYTCGDALSGIATCEPDQTVSGEGADQSVTGSAKDNADNTNSATVSGLNLDKSAPSVSVTGVSNGATYTLGSVPAAGCSTSDSLSGVDSEATLGTSGGPVGSVTVACAGGTDKAGNPAAPVVATYSVIYSWTGFYAPIDNPVTGKMNGVKAGSSVPAKFSLGGYQGLSILAAGYPSWKRITCDSGADVSGDTPTTSAGSSTLSYDYSTGVYSYVWKTDKAWAGHCLRLTLMLNDETSHSVDFKMLK